MRVIRFLAAPLVVALLLAPVWATDYKRNVIDPSYRHDRYGTLPRDIIKEFRAYITSFDSDDDDDGDGISDRRGIPEWVSYEMREIPRKLRKGPPRPAPWITDEELAAKGIAPTDATYQYSAVFRKRNANWYVRGHLCMKEHAWRLGAEADWNTHTMLNAVPQRDNFNSGIWLDLENKTGGWANAHTAVWIIAGPIFNNRRPTKTLGEGKEMKIAIPDALFKIVVRESDSPNRPHVLAFIYSQECRQCKIRKRPYDHTEHLVSVREIEERTSLRFFTNLPAADREAIRQTKASRLWN